MFSKRNDDWLNSLTVLTKKIFNLFNERRKTDVTECDEVLDKFCAIGNFYSLVREDVLGRGSVSLGEFLLEKTRTRRTG